MNETESLHSLRIFYKRAPSKECPTTLSRPILFSSDITRCPILTSTLLPSTPPTSHPRCALPTARATSSRSAASRTLNRSPLAPAPPSPWHPASTPPPPRLLGRKSRIRRMRPTCLRRPWRLVVFRHGRGTVRAGRFRSSQMRPCASGRPRVRRTR